MMSQQLCKAQKALRRASEYIEDGKFRWYCPNSRRRSMRTGKKLHSKANRRLSKRIIEEQFE